MANEEHSRGRRANIPDASTKLGDNWIMNVPTDPETEPAAIAKRQLTDVSKAFNKLERRRGLAPTVDELVEEVMLPASIITRKLKELGKTPSIPEPTPPAEPNE